MLVILKTPNSQKIQGHGKMSIILALSLLSWVILHTSKSYMPCLRAVVSWVTSTSTLEDWLLPWSPMGQTWEPQRMPWPTCLQTWLCNRRGTWNQAAQTVSILTIHFRLMILTWYMLCRDKPKPARQMKTKMIILLWQFARARQVTISRVMCIYWQYLLMKTVKRTRGKDTAEGLPSSMSFTRTLLAPLESSALDSGDELDIIARFSAWASPLNMVTKELKHFTFKAPTSKFDRQHVLVFADQSFDFSYHHKASKQVKGLFVDGTI